MAGVIRGIDAQRRLVIPEITLKAAGIEPKDLVEVWAGQDDEGHPCLFIRKHTIGCTLCGDDEVSYRYQGKPLCSECITVIKEMEVE